MRLHVTYNAFNGLEFLRPNVLNMRPVADVITVVWQSTSNFGNPATEPIEETIQNLKGEGLIDHDIFYETDTELGGVGNELNKRKLGLGNAAQTGCTHHLDMDVDEFYFTQQVVRAKQQIEQHGWPVTYCRIVEYHKAVTYRCKELRSDLHAPFIMQADRQLKLRSKTPVLLDPKRRAQPHEGYHVFDQRELLMHHYSLVRNDFSGKLNDANNRRRNQKRLQAVWEFDPVNYVTVANYFNIP